jgi:hypothetical protein
MKETNQISPDQIEISAPKPIQKQKVLLGKLRPQPGQKVFEVDMVTAIVKESVYERVNAKLLPDGTTKVEKKINVKDGHLYCVALNKRNAEKRFLKMINGK